MSMQKEKKKVACVIQQRKNILMQKGCMSEVAFCLEPLSLHSTFLVVVWSERRLSPSITLM